MDIATQQPRVALALHQDIQQHPRLIDCAPQLVPRTGDRQQDLVQVPLITGCRQPAADLFGKRLAELQRLLAPVDLLRSSTMADSDAARGQQLVHHAQG